MKIKTETKTETDKINPREDCIICGKKINRAKSKSGDTLRRGKNAVTCSMKCSKVYIRGRKYPKKSLLKERDKEYMEKCKCKICSGEFIGNGDECNNCKKSLEKWRKQNGRYIV